MFLSAAILLTSTSEPHVMSETQQIAFQIAEHLDQALCLSGSLRPDTDLLEEGIVDSLMIMDLVEHIHATYGLRLNPADLKPLHFRSTMALSELVVATRTASNHVPVS